MSPLIRLALTVWLSSVPSMTGAHDGKANHSGQGQVSVGPSAGYAFSIPEPGSYSLPPIRPAGGGTVLDETGRVKELSDLVRGRITVLAFMYTRCGDVCPTATLQMSVLQDLAAHDRKLTGRFHLVSVSFDPDHDTPAVMADHAAHWRSAQAGSPVWHFLTAPDRRTLAPLLTAYDQAIGAKPDPGAVGGPLHHIFRAYLIDSSGQIRNIYSLDFLDPALVLNDVRTVLIDLETDSDGTHQMSRGPIQKEGSSR